RTWANQVENVFSLSASRSRPEISFQTRSAVSSIGFSTLSGRSFARPKRRASIATSEPALNGLSGGVGSTEKRGFTRDFRNRPHTFPHLWICVWMDDDL